ncbi:MAG: methyltransferase domain-containing protein [Candidatus Yonathbacteria bacterium]|nr:methyltransferase domain-containing protein [Candidatus Yonathbacteria bacterium]
MHTDARTSEELKRHYEIERALAQKLRQANREERLRLYPQVYDELYREVPFLKTNPETIDRAHLRSTLRLLKPFLGQDKTFLEIGAGNLAVSREVARHVNQVYTLDVSKEFATALGPIPSNIRLIISDGLSVPIPPASVDIAYSSQLMEHLHPDDAKEQLKNIYAALKPGGSYLCNTPHRLNGPHDISRYFDETATGFHLKEYTNGELALLMKEAGFKRVYSLTGAKGYVVPCPLFFLEAIESLLNLLPQKARKACSRWLPVKVLLGVRLVGKKSAS